jgi:hypothetical protein
MKFTQLFVVYLINLVIMNVSLAHIAIELRAIRITELREKKRDIEILINRYNKEKNE